MGRRTRKPNTPLTRRTFVRGLAAGGAIASVAPHIWIPGRARAQSSAHGALRHLLYIRLGGGFRFPIAFNADVAEEFNPFGKASGVAEGTEWGVGQLLSRSGFLDGEDGAARAALGMQPVTDISNQMSVLTCVDHEPTSAGADGNHGSGLERYYTGYADGTTGFFTMINYGLRERVAAAAAEDKLLLPAFVLGGSGMGRGIDEYAAHRPPVLSGRGFDDFGVEKGAFPDWANDMVARTDERYRDRQHEALKLHVQTYMDTREATKEYSDIFNSDALKIRNGSDEQVDGISNAELESMFGDTRAARDMRLALRLFHYGSPAVYLDQGGYDMHSGEEAGLPGQFDDLNQLISALEASLKRMEHPEGGSYWDHTMVVFGSEFSRTARGRRFNSARGSDHNSDRATRWMSMPFMGGLVARPGAQIGSTASGDLAPGGAVFSYRSVMKTLMDSLGCDHAEFFPADAPFDDLFT